MIFVGDKVIVFGAGSDFAHAVELTTPEVGDNVALYNLKDKTRIAVPTLTFGIGDFAFVSPNFDFAGFDFKLDFNFQLIPLMISLYGNFTDHDLKVYLGGSFFYGDTPFTRAGGCEKRLTDPRYGDVEYNFGDNTMDQGGPHPDDVAVCLKFYSDGIEIWILSSRYYDYGAVGTAKVYLFGTLVAEVSLTNLVQNHVFYHNEKWTKP